MNGRGTKRGLAVTGAWLPLPLDFLRSRACAEISPHGVKLLVDFRSMLGPNATCNGNVSLTPKMMAVRGCSSRDTLGAAVRELIGYGLLIQARQGSRLDCSLYASTLFPLDCDTRKLDVGPGSYRTTDWMCGGDLANAPTEARKARWRHARKGASTGSRKAGKTQTVAPPRDNVPPECPAPGRSNAENETDFPSSSRLGTNPAIFEGVSVPPRVTYLDKPSLQPSDAVQAEQTEVSA